MSIVDGLLGGGGKEVPAMAANEFSIMEDLLTSSKEDMNIALFDLVMDPPSVEHLLAASSGQQPTALQQGPRFDLNEGCTAIADNLSLPSDQCIRIALGEADWHLNKEGSELGGLKPHGKGIARLAVPLKKSLLCNPTHKTKSSHGRKPNGATEKAGRKTIKASTKMKKCLSGDEKATALLLESSGIIAKNGSITAVGEDLFGEQFVDPMGAGLVEGMRAAFGLNSEGAGGCLNGLALEAEE